MRKLRPTVYGVGINDANYPIKPIQPDGTATLCPFYRTWTGMLSRCYSSKFLERNPTYIGCTVCEPWLVFSNFKAWMEQQDWQGKQLDKDLLVTGNKVYGPDTCIFVTPAINALLSLCNKARGEYPLGVSKNIIKGTSYFVAHCSMYGKAKHLGYFKTVDEASKAYQHAKHAYIAELANQQTNPRLRDALNRIDLTSKELLPNQSIDLATV